MTALAERPSTSTAPTVRGTVRAVRTPLALAVLLVLVLAAGALLTLPGPTGRLDPDSYTPAGSRAVAELLRARGVPVRRVGTVEEALQGGSHGLLVVPTPAALTRPELARLTARAGELLVVGADQEQVDALGGGIDVAGPLAVQPRRAACDLPAAVAAGDVLLGGRSYRARGEASTGCYASGGRPTLLRLVGLRLTLLGDGTLLTNEALDERGDAALALGLLAPSDEVRWLVPAPGRPAASSGRTPVSALLPPWVGAAVLQLLVAAAVLALWRARRLGRVVVEPLPVVVRASESVEGRARLYRAARARDRAADVLRSAARARLVRRLGLPASADAATVVEAVHDRTGRDPAALGVLLAGSAPGDDTALVRLADDLDDVVRAATGPATPRPVAGPEGGAPADGPAPEQSQGGSTA